MLKLEHGANGNALKAVHDGRRRLQNMKRALVCDSRPQHTISIAISVTPEQDACHGRGSSQMLRSPI